MRTTTDPTGTPPPRSRLRPQPTLVALRIAISRRELFSNLVRRELGIRYRRSVLGWGWSLAQPLLMSAVYVIVLGKIFRMKAAVGHPSGMTVYAFYLLAAILPWNFVANGASTAMTTLMASSNVITKIALPRELIPASAIAALGVSLSIELSVLAVVEAITGNVMLYLIPLAVLLVALEFIFATGLGLWLSALNIRYRDVQHLTNVLFTIWFYLTPIIYSPTMIPERSTLFGVDLPARAIALANPMARFVIAFRNVFYDFRIPDGGTLAWCFGWSLAVFVLGYRFYRVRAPYFVEDL